MTIEAWLKTTTEQLTKAGVSSARLDAQVLLTDALGTNKAWLLAHQDEDVEEYAFKWLKPALEARLSGIPLAYVRGHIEFYGRSFLVNPRVLIPRPETESLIEMIKKYVPHGSRLLDVGTGSGIIAITTARELPEAVIEACDISPEALETAKQNAEIRDAGDIKFFVSDLLESATGSYNAIIANLPYVSRDWKVSPETAAEPELALYADNDGLQLINKFITQVPKYLAPGGQLILEADPRQHKAIQKAADEQALKFVTADGFGLCFTQGA